MTFEPLSDPFIQHCEDSLASIPSDPAASPPAPSTAGLFLSEVPDQPLNWLWPGRIPLGHLTLLDASPGSDPSFLALALVACVSSGKPLPDGIPTQPGNVILYAPYDSASAILKPRLQAAGGDPTRVLLFCPSIVDTPRAHPFALPRDLDQLANAIRLLSARLVILNPAHAIPGLLHCLPALSELARQTNCAILLIRSLSQPPADPFRPSGSPAFLYEAVCSRLLLIPDPADERHHLLLTTRHSFCSQPAILAYDLPLSDGDIPTLQWLAPQDRTCLARLSTGPLYSPQRQAILRFLRENPDPQSIQNILNATCYDREAGRKMLTRMKLAGELVCIARGLYTIPTGPDPVPNVPIVSDLSALSTPAVPGVPTIPSSPHQAPDNTPLCDVPSPSAISPTDQITNLISTHSPLSLVPDVPNPPEAVCPASYSLDANNKSSLQPDVG